MRLQFNKFYSPDDAPGITNQGDGASDDNLETLELLNVEDEPEVIDIKGIKEKSLDDDDESTPDDDEEDDELKEIEEELAGPKEEDLELTTPVRRKEILAKYPKLFKDFPYLEKAYYREQQFTEINPTIEDARVASEKAKI